MVDDVHLTSYGAAASRALEASIQKAKASAPLAPVTVVVGSNFAGLAARRLLGGTTGVANVGFVTAFRLAELLGSDLLLDRRPLTNPVLGAAVRRVLAEEPGRFARVRDHVATEVALAGLHAELSNVSPASLDRLEVDGGTVARSAVRFHRAIRGHLGAFHDEADLAAAAAARADLAEALVPHGHVIWYLPAPMTAPLGDFMAAVLAAAPSTVVLGVTGDRSADDAVRRTCERAGVRVAEPHPPSIHDPVVADRIVSVTDADEEVRAVLRQVLALASQGVRLDRIGVFHPVPDPYVGLLEQHFAAAGVPSNGPSRTTLAESAAGRTLLAALALPAQRWRRDRVMALVSGAPVLAPGGPARPTAWERLSREAGVVQDLDDWRRKVDARRVRLDGQLDSLDPAADGAERRARSMQRTRDDLDQMLGFVDALAGAVRSVERARSWAEKADAATTLLRSLLGSGLHPGWPESEQDALERVEDALSRLASLDEIESDPTHQVFVRALESELRVTGGRRGRFGEGVMFGPLASAAGHDLDAVFVLGCAEGLCPGARREDSMLPDDARQLTDGELELRTAALHEQHRWFLAALASAPAGRRVLTFPRGDLRSGRESLPSRWLLDTATALRGERVDSTRFGELRHEAIEVVPSHAAGLHGAVRHASVHDRDLVVLDDHRERGGDLLDHPVAGPVRRGLLAQVERRSERFTEWDGNLGGQPIASTADRPQSPTRLETWAQCGFKYFLGQVLGLSERDDPERVLDLSPLDRGSGVHVALERFLLEVLEQGAPEPDEPWSPEHRRRLAEIAEETFAEYERRGRTGRPVNWELTKGDLLAVLQDFLDADDRHRSATRSRPERVELPFGMDDAQPVRLTLPDGRVLAFRGKADRVDRTESGRRLVSDYKTGKGDRYRELASDPFRSGTTLQLGFYAEAARQQLGADEVEAHYWMVDTAGFKRYGYPWTDDRRERFLEVVSTIVEGIEAGVFPMVPGEWDTFFRTNDRCRYCEFDRLCPRDRGEQAEAKQDAPQLAQRERLVPGEDS